LIYSIALKLKLKSGGYEGYKKAHDTLWPELADGMKRSNVSMAIFKDGQNLYVFASAPTKADWLRSREHPVLQRWSSHMTSFLEADASGAIVCDSMERLFVFGLYVSSD